MPIHEVASLITSIRTAYEIAKGINSLKVEVERNQAIAEILEALLSVQSNALTMQSSFQELQQTKAEIEKKLLELEQWAKTESQYDLEEIHRGILVYSQKNRDKLKQPKHWLCTNCWQEKKKSILQADYHHEGAAAYTCPRCKTKIAMRFKADTPVIVRTRSRWDEGW